jgi:hypothetical protein
MNLHLGYPGVTKGLKLIGITPISKLKRGHMHLTYSQTKNNAHRLPTYNIL